MDTSAHQLAPRIGCGAKTCPAISTPWWVWKAPPILQPLSQTSDPAVWLCLLALTVFLSGWVWVVLGVRPPAGALLLFLLWPVASFRLGRGLAGALGVTASFTLSFLLGNTVLAVALMLVKLVLPIRLSVAVWVALAAGWLAPWVLPDRCQRQPHEGPRTSLVEVFVVLLCLIAGTAWSQHLFWPTAVSGDQVIFKPWSDSMIHATYVARLLERESILQLGNYEIRGLPASAYHYASYVFPALGTALVGCSAFEGLCALWTPLGFFFLGISAYALARSLWGEGAGLAAAAAVLLLPDAALLPFGNPMLSYFNLLVVAPAGLYGIAVAATALLLVGEAARRADTVALLGALAVAASVACFKSHVFVAAFPLTVVYAILAWPNLLMRWRCLMFVALLFIAFAGSKILQRYEIGPGLYPSRTGGDFYFYVLAEQMPKNICGAWYAVFKPEGGFRTHMGRAAVLLTLATFGGHVLLYPLTLVLGAIRRNLRVSDLLPGAALVIYLAMALCLPRNQGQGTPEELQHRPFVWAYFLVVGLSVARLAAQIAPLLPGKAIWLGALLCLGLLVVPLSQGTTVHHQRTAWGHEFTDLAVPKGLVDCARFIRRSSDSLDFVQESHPREALHDLGALAERRSFLTHPEAFRRINKPFRETGCAEYLKQLEQLRQAATLAQLRQSAQETGIRWFLLQPADPVAWPSCVVEHPAFTAGGYRVYDLHNPPVNGYASASAGGDWRLGRIRGGEPGKRGSIREHEAR
jgi:hypothetical protein